MFDRKRICTAIVNAAMQDGEPLSENVAKAVAFPMTDWLGDLKKLIKFFEDPESMTLEEANTLQYGFQQFKQEPMKLYLPMKSVQDLDL
jgi:hypothetical protein